MGIQGLLQFLKPFTAKNVHLSQLGGMRVGIDAYVTLHHSLYTCCSELYEDQHTNSTNANTKQQQESTIKYVDYCMKLIYKLLEQDCLEVYIVFDGNNLPAKHATNQERQKKREMNRVEVEKLLNKGKMKEARNIMARCIDVTPLMAYRWMERIEDLPLDLRQKVKYIVGKYFEKN